MSNSSCALSDSFQDNLLAAPIYTRPSEFERHKVPDILLSGDATKIADWKEEQAYQKTREKRPDLLNKK